MGSRGSKYDSGIKHTQAIDWETRQTSRDILAGFKYKSGYQVVARTKNLKGMQILGVIDENETNAELSKQLGWRLQEQEILSQITEEDLATGQGESGSYYHDKLEIVYEHVFEVNINGEIKKVEFYIKAYKGYGGKIMIDSIHPKMHHASTHQSWDEHKGFVW